MQKSRRQPLRVLLAVLILIAVVWWQHLAIYDWSRLRGYQAPAGVVALADHTTMKNSTRRLFYVNHPAIEDKSQFNADCSDSEQTIVLGCFITAKGIFLYKIDDPRLDGVLEVTAAHETLHAAYERLSSNERENIDQLTAAAFAKVTDQRIRKTVEAYRSRNPSIVPNELHSILGTEVQDLPTDLENYYGKYFTNRSTVVAFSEKYEHAFTERQDMISEYDGQLKNLKQQIDGLQASLQVLQETLSTQKNQMDELYAAKQFEQYNALVAPYNAKVRLYNTQVTTDQNFIDKYNRLVAARNAIALEEGELVKAIDSRPTPVKTQ